MIAMSNYELTRTVELGNNPQLLQTIMIQMKIKMKHVNQKIDHHSPYAIWYPSSVYHTEDKIRNMHFTY